MFLLKIRTSYFFTSSKLHYYFDFLVNLATAYAKANVLDKFSLPSHSRNFVGGVTEDNVVLQGDHLKSMDSRSGDFPPSSVDSGSVRRGLDFPYSTLTMGVGAENGPPSRFWGDLMGVSAEAQSTLYSILYDINFYILLKKNFFLL
jgi:hypothetical protein